MNSDYEIVVAGAGPSGALTAALLALEGHEVLLLDKSGFPRDKICGEAVPYHALNILDGAGMKNIIEEFLARGEFHPLTQAHLYSPENHEVIVPLHESDKGYKKALKDNNPTLEALKQYQKLCDKFLFKEMRKMFALQKFFLRYPLLLDFTAKRLKNDFQPLKHHLAKL